jgi:hypothetical protein
MSNYRGIVIAESLIDWAWINQVRVVDAQIEHDPNNRNDLWHLYTVEAREDQVLALRDLLKPKGYYAHFISTPRKGLVIFPAQSFAVNPTNEATWQPAIDFGVAMGIPARQMNFGFEGLA